MKLNGLRVSRETQERLQHFAALFQKWAKAINLVAPSTLDDLWHRHIADSSQIFQIHPQPATWVDLGSGGGFPGVITAIFLAELQGGWVHLVESNHKKAAFLRTALRKQMRAAACIAFESKMPIRRLANAERFQRARLPILMGLSGIRPLGCLARKIVVAFFRKAGITGRKSTKHVVGGNSIC